MLADI